MGALEIWNKSDRMNLSNVIFLAIQSSTYFKGLYRFKTYHEVVQEVRTEVMSIDPWIKGTRTPSTCMCLLFKLFTLRLTMKQLKNMLEKDPSQTVRAMAVLYLRLCCKPQSMWDWLRPLIEDDSELTLVPDKPAVMIKEQRFFDVLLPRIPVPIHRKMLDSDELKAAEQLHIQAFNNKVGGGGASRTASREGTEGGRGRSDRGDKHRGDSRRDDRRGSRYDDRDRYRGRRDDRRDDRGWERGGRDDRYRGRSDDRGRGEYEYGRAGDNGRDSRDRGYDRRRYDDRRERRSRERYSREDDRYGGYKRRRSSSRSPSPSKRRRTGDASPSPARRPAPEAPGAATSAAGSASATFKKLQLLYGSSSAAGSAAAPAKPSAPLTARERQERLLKEAAALDLKHTSEDVVRLGY